MMKVLEVTNWKNVNAVMTVFLLKTRKIVIPVPIVPAVNVRRIAYTVTTAWMSTPAPIVETLSSVLAVHMSANRCIAMTAYFVWGVQD